jgi:hypothetical protein
MNCRAVAFVAVLAVGCGGRASSSSGGAGAASGTNVPIGSAGQSGGASGMGVASGSGGAAACVAAGGQCVAGVGFCANVGPGATAASCLDVSTDMLCCAVNDDAGCTEIQASNYNQSCKSDSDCVTVNVGNACAECIFACAENVGAISTGAMAQYTADVAKTPAGVALCYCPQPPVGLLVPCCSSGQCHADNECSSLDGSTAPDAGPDGDAAGAPLECASNGIAFALTIDATGPVYYGPFGSFGCVSWLTIAPAGEPRLTFLPPGLPLLTLLPGTCNAGCPVSGPEPAMAQSFTWDGTYYRSDVGNCETPVCAPAGNYVATICVGYAGADAGPFSPETAPPTCKQVPVAWPPTSADQSIVESITPTPDGG